MRIRRYMDLLQEYKGESHGYSEDQDIFVEFNMYPPKQYPALMRLGEAIAANHYKAVFVDMPRSTDFAGLSERESSLLQIWQTLEAFRIRLVDVSADPDELLSKRLIEHFGEDARYLAHGLHRGHDYVAYFPASAADIAEAAFEMESNWEDWRRNEAVVDAIEHRTSCLARDNPYASGHGPWISDPLGHMLLEKKWKRQREEFDARRKTGETLYLCSPDGTPKLVDEGHFWGSATVRTAESLTKAEARLAEFGFSKAVDGQIVSFQRSVGELVLFADPREEGKIKIAAYRPVPLKGKQKKQKYETVGTDVSIPDRWWTKNTAARFEDFLARTISSGWQMHPLGGHQTKRERYEAGKQS